MMQGRRLTNLTGWALGILGTLVYGLTMEPTVSWWDCGEFIAVSARLQVGHPPGAPFYQLLAHLFTLLAANPARVAWWCNALSAVAGGLTVMMLYWCLLLVLEGDRTRRWTKYVGAGVGALCYLFCDTVWFSAVESEVYALAMLLASTMLWAMLRWYRCEDEREAPRWLLLIALLMGLGYCTHQLTLLTAPALLVLFVVKTFVDNRGRGWERLKSMLGWLPLLLLMFAIGLTPYLIIPIRATADTPINECHSGRWEDVKAYVNRDRYEKAPVYPRMWRHRENDALYASTWCGGDTSAVGNLKYYGSYQLTYMYLRYLMWNFAGRYNDRQGYGSPQNGQFVTGIGPLDAMLVGSGSRPPESLHTKGHNVYFLLPLLLGVLGLMWLREDRRMFWTVLTLFLMGGVVLGIYLNHPCYEPRERDYAYVLSFMAFAMFIGVGACRAAAWIFEKVARMRCGRKAAAATAAAVLLGVPALMACQNWDDHDRSNRYTAYDSGMNILNTCDRDENGTVLFCYGDNDTFPLWYLQSVEEARPDVRVENIGLIGWRSFMELLGESVEAERPVYFTHYAYNQFKDYFPGRFQLEGFAYRLADEPCDSVAVDAALRHVMEDMRWHSLEGVYVDEVSCKFLEMYWRDVLLIANNLTDMGRGDDAGRILHKTLDEIPMRELQDVRLMYAIVQAFGVLQDDAAATLRQELRGILAEQLEYLHAMPKSRQRAMPFTIGPREEVWMEL